MSQREEKLWKDFLQGIRDDNEDQVKRILLETGNPNLGGGKSNFLTRKITTTQGTLTVLHLAVKHGAERIIKLVFENGVNVNTTSLPHKFTALHMAVERDNHGIIELLLSQEDINVNACDEYGHTPLKLASEKGNQQTVERLIQKGADVTKADSVYNTAIHVAADKGHFDVLLLLLQEAVAKNPGIIGKQNKDKNTPLHLAVARECQNSVALLLCYGAGSSMELENRHNETPKQLAKGNKVILELLENPSKAQQHLMELTRRVNKGIGRGCSVEADSETASERSASDPPEVIINQLKNRDLPKRATHLDVSRLPVDVLLLTVEDCEFLSCLAFLNPDFCRSFHRDLAYVYLGDMGKDERKLNVAVMNCYRGSASAGGSTVVILNAVKVLRPKSVFCVGSCRSLDCNKVKLGDVVILEKLITYGPCKITEGGIEERGVKVPLKSGLLRVMLRACDGWQPPLKDLDAREVEIHRGAFLSGPEEVIDRKRCETLLERFPEVVAIEREGEGVYTAAHDLDIEWTVIKGISGYADGRNESNSWRPFASLMAASLMAHILSDAIPFQDMRHYRNEAEERGERRTACKMCKKVGNSGGRRKKQRKGK